MLITLTFVATGRTIFPMIWGEPKQDAHWPRQTLPAGAAEAARSSSRCVVLGIYIPPPVNALIREVARVAGGPMTSALVRTLRPAEIAAPARAGGVARRLLDARAARAARVVTLFGAPRRRAASLAHGRSRGPRRRARSCSRDARRSAQRGYHELTSELPGAALLRAGAPRAARRAHRRPPVAEADPLRGRETSARWTRTRSTRSRARRCTRSPSARSTPA